MQEEAWHRSFFDKGALAWYGKFTWESAHAWNLMILCLYDFYIYGAFELLCNFIANL